MSVPVEVLFVDELVLLLAFDAADAGDTSEGEEVRLVQLGAGRDEAGYAL